MNITIYSVDNCNPCIQLKKYLNEKGVDYIEKSVKGNQTLKDELIRVSGQSRVPVTIIDGTVIRGFNKIAINKHLT
jgi:glutaredoxin